MEALDAKMDVIMKKLEKLDAIDANFEETISRLESEVKDLKKRKKLEKKVDEFEESLQYNDERQKTQQET